jgi:hypothetical protein
MFLDQEDFGGEDEADIISFNINISYLIQRQCSPSERLERMQNVRDLLKKWHDAYWEEVEDPSATGIRYSTFGRLCQLMHRQYEFEYFIDDECIRSGDEVLTMCTLECMTYAAGLNEFSYEPVLQAVLEMVPQPKFQRMAVGALRIFRHRDLLEEILEHPAHSILLTQFIEKSKQFEEHPAHSIPLTQFIEKSKQFEVPRETETKEEGGEKEEKGAEEEENGLDGEYVMWVADCISLFADCESFTEKLKTSKIDLVVPILNWLKCENTQIVSSMLDIIEPLLKRRNLAIEFCESGIVDILVHLEPSVFFSGPIANCLDTFSQSPEVIIKVGQIPQTSLNDLMRYILRLALKGSPSAATSVLWALQRLLSVSRVRAVFDSFGGFHQVMSLLDDARLLLMQAHISVAGGSLSRPISACASLRAYLQSSLLEFCRNELGLRDQKIHV